MTALTPEVQAVIEDVLAWHQPKGPPWKDCFSCGRRYPCPTRTRLSALLPPPKPRVEVTDEMVVDFIEALFGPGENPNPDVWRHEANRLANSPLCPAAWLPEPPQDERVTELREAAAWFVSNRYSANAWNRLRAALQAFDGEDDK